MRSRSNILLAAGISVFMLTACGDDISVTIPESTSRDVEVSAESTPVPVELPSFSINEITIVGSRCGPFTPALDDISSGRAQFPDIIAFLSEEFEKAFGYKGFKAGFVF